jgi:hypothetical protein
VHDEIERVARDRTVRGVVSVFVVLAARDGERELRRRCAARGRSARAAGRAALTAAREPIPIVARGVEPGGLDVHGVRPVRRRVHRSAPRDFLEGVVARDFPFDRHDLVRHSAARHERLGREPRPEHDRVRLGIAGCDAERERGRRERRVRRARRERPQQAGSGDTDAGSNERAP